VNKSLWFFGFLAFTAILFLLLRLTIRIVNQLKKARNPLFPYDEEASSGEPLVTKAKVTPEALGIQFIKWIQTDPPTLPLNAVPIDRYTTEFVYLQTFAFDLAAHLKLGDTYEKKVILDVFWDYITGAGVYTETFQLRMLRYTDAVKETVFDNIHEALGHAFAETCGTPENDSIRKVGENTVRLIVNRLNHLFDHVTIDMDPVKFSTFEPTQT
jgi:hypothetical protein